MLLNSINPRGEEAMSLAAELRMKYKVPVIPVNCVTMTMEDLSVFWKRCSMSSRM